MVDEDFDVPDEEEVPEHLQKKWDNEEFQEEFGGKAFMNCPNCGQQVEKKSFSCLYCGETIFHDSGMIGRLGNWLKRGNAIWIVLLIVLGFLFLMNFF